MQRNRIFVGSNPSSWMGNTPISRVPTSASKSGLTSSTPGDSAVQIKTDYPSSTNGFYYIKLSSWASPKKIYCDMTNGGYMLWAQRINSTTTIDIRYSGFFAGYAASAALLNEWTDLSTQEGFVDMWPYLNGTRTLKALISVTGRSASNPGTGTNWVTATENGTSFANATYTLFTGGGTTCPSSASRYDWTNTVVNANWSNTHSSGGTSCPGWTYSSSTYVGNWISVADCGACYAPSPNLFGNGYTSYYAYSPNTYDWDYFDYGLVGKWLNGSTGTVTTYDTNTQLWVK